MVTLNQVLTGLKTYLENELIAQITGLNKWIVGAGIAMAIDNGAEIFNQLKQNPAIKALNIINKEDEIDIDKIYKYLSEQASKSSVTFTVPIVGAITLKKKDVDKIYNLITGEV